MENFKKYVMDLFQFLVFNEGFIPEIRENNIVVYKKSEYNISIYLEYTDAYLTINDGIEDYDMRIINLVMNNRKIDTYSYVDNIQEKIVLQLKNYIPILKKILNYISIGDFQWKIKYREYYQDLRHIQKVLGSPFIFSHPIYIKFVNQDVTWKIDLENYIKQ